MMLCCWSKELVVCLVCISTVQKNPFLILKKIDDNLKKSFIDFLVKIHLCAHSTKKVSANHLT
jgi:hypothetical protein